MSKLFSGNKSTALKWSLSIGIIIVLNLFFNYGINVFHEEPKYEDFCPIELNSKYIDNEAQCVEEGGVWNVDNYPRTVVEGQAAITGYCDLSYNCRQAYDEARDDYNKVVFIVLVVLGIASLLTGMSLAVDAVATGLSYGGVLSLVIASIRFWPSADNLIKLLILAVALGLLIWVGVKKFAE